MTLIGSRVVLVIPTQNPADTAAAQGAPPRWAMHRRHGWRGVVGGVVWLVIVIYVLWLATRTVRAVERIADKLKDRTP